MAAARGFLASKYTREKHEPFSEINVIPLVDVMLVLLIVFMIAAPLLTTGVDVDLPESSAMQLKDQVEPIVVSLRHDGSLYIQETKVESDTLIPKLEAISKSNQKAVIYVRGDQKLPYGAVMDVMGKINAAGFSKVALVTQIPQDKK